MGRRRERGEELIMAKRMKTIKEVIEKEEGREMEWKEHTKSRAIRGAIRRAKVVTIEMVMTDDVIHIEIPKATLLRQLPDGYGMA